MVSQSSRLQFCAASTPSARPALLTRPRNLSKPAGKLAMACSMALRSRTSSTRPCTSVLADSSAHRASRRSLRRPVSTSFQPASAKRRAVASPKPEVAPVMNTVDVMLCSSRWIVIGSLAACPRRVLAATRQDTVHFFDHMWQTLTADGSAPAMRTLSTRLSPRIGATCPRYGTLSATYGRWISFR